jgi:hypothetical protein
MEWILAVAKAAVGVLRNGFQWSCAGVRFGFVRISRLSANQDETHILE